MLKFLKRLIAGRKRVATTIATKDAPSYHDLHITIPGMERTSIFDLPYNLHVRCSRIAGWELWQCTDPVKQDYVLKGSEYSTSLPLTLDVGGHIVVNNTGENCG